MGEILEKVQVHVPYALLREKVLPMVIREGINPEIGISHLDLDRFSQADFRETAERLHGHGLSVTFHAPFLDLRPGAIDPQIRQVTLDRFLRVFALIPWFSPRSVVCHPSFDERYYVSTGEAQWLENSIETWRRLLAEIGGTETIIVLENVYERSPRPLRQLLSALASPQARFCFDTGHANAFGNTPVAEWIESLGEYLGEVHLHDNHGATDEHLPVGEGTFPFRELMTLLHQGRRTPILTLESHSDESLRRMLENLRTMKLLENW
ncbi:MAG: sugar phosphate isomerase/epimerase [Deltaproteobacteria bacterium]|nr:sugar phosphate isomerase/epimerase [Deltaproteobacteria bacterium]